MVVENGEVWGKGRRVAFVEEYFEIVTQAFETCQSIAASAVHKEVHE